MEPQTANDLERKANGILRDLGMWRVPVNPFAIAREEGIELAPGRYGPRFDGRVEYVPAAGVFALYYRGGAEEEADGRTRFTIGHELGHFYLHRDALLRGEVHCSTSDFRSRNPRELEADEFAARLLMPRELFMRAVKQFRQRVCVLAELCHLADNVFHTSVTSTVRRYCQCDIEPASMVISGDGRVKWAVASEDMRRLGMGYIEYGSPIPRQSGTAALWSQLRAGEYAKPADSGVLASVWFERGYRRRLWEEAMPLGATGLVLTYLTFENPPD